MKKNNVLKLLLLFCLIVSNQVSAQKRRTVAVDSSNVNGTDYRFSPMFYMPPTIGSSDVKLNLEIYTNKLDVNQIRVLKFANQNDTKNSIGQIEIAKPDTSLVLTLNLNKDLEKINTPLNIKGQFTESAQGIVELNSSDKTSASYDINKTPRLVVDYELAKEPYGAAWSQMNGNAQHSNQIDWVYERLTYEFAFGLDWTKLKNFDVAKANDKKYDYLSSYKNKPIVFSKGNPSYVLAFSGIQSDQELWRTTKVFPDKKPVITPDGKMIYVSEKQTLEVLELNEGKDIASKALSDIKITIENKTHSINKVTNDITLGYDGTLYMPIANANGNFGIVALSAYPQLMPRWFYNTTNAVGTVSLSQNEKMVFFIETDKTSQKSRLVVLDNRNGAVLTQTEGILGSYANDGNSYIPPVVLQTIDKDTTAVYVLDGNKTSNKLYIFKVHYDQFFDEDGQRINQPPLTYFTLKKSGYSDNKGISQPVVLNNEEVFLGLMNKAKKYNIKKDEFYSVQNNNIDDNTIGFSSGSGSNYAMVLSGDDYVFLYSFLGANRVESTYNNGINMYITNWTNAVINQNFSIYVQLKNGIIRQFYHIQINENAKSIALNDIKNKYTYQCTGPIAVTATTVTENTQAIVQGRKISFPQGFKVQKGASLTFQIIK